MCLQWLSQRRGSGDGVVVTSGGGFGHIWGGRFREKECVGWGGSVAVEGGCGHDEDLQQEL